MSFRYQLPDDSVVAGISVNLTPSLESNEVEFSTLTSWIDRGWDYVNLVDFRGNAKGFSHKIRVRVPSRINMLSQILWTQPAPWRRSRWGYMLQSDEDGTGMLVDDTGARILLDRE